MAVPAWAVREMDQTGDGFISLLDVQNVRDSNVDWYTGEQAIAKRAASPAFFEDFRSLFCCFGFSYAQPFSLNAACAWRMRHMHKSKSKSKSKESRFLRKQTTKPHNHDRLIITTIKLRLINVILFCF